jgi:predicted ester cyclase
MHGSCGHDRFLWEGLGALPGEPGPNPHMVIDQIVEDGPSIAVRFVMSGVHRAPFMGIATSGRSYVLPGITILHFAGERCIERWASADTLQLFTQLGAIRMAGA